MVILHSQPRSISNILGEFLTHFPGVFYAFEPNQDIPSALAEMLLTCDFAKSKEHFLAYLSDSKIQSESQSSPFSRNTRVWRHCRRLGRCFDYKLYESGACELFPVRLIHQTNLYALEDLLQRIPNLKVKDQSHFCLRRIRHISRGWRW